MRDIMHTIEELGDNKLVLALLNALNNYYLYILDAELNVSQEEQEE
jgi:hypothetical protein